jgi:hypothetical protein
MQIVVHKNTTLTACQRFFIERSLELLHLGSIDSYRVKLNNPRSILEELKYCLQEFEVGRIKHFSTIKAKENGKKAIIDEALSLLANHSNYLTFSSISKKYLEQLFKTTDEHSYKKVISCIDILLRENEGYLNAIINGLETLLKENASTFSKLEDIDQSLNILFSELISNGYSKGFLYKLVYGIFVNSLLAGRNFDDHFNNFKQRIIDTPARYEVMAYVKRNVYSLRKGLNQLSTQHQSLIPSYNPADANCLKQEAFYDEISQHLSNEFPLLGYRGMKLKQWFFKPNKIANATDYLKTHRTNLEIHFTRIYRLRNEIIHDAATNTNNEQIASNLRYYLTFMLNELIDFLSKTNNKEVSIEDYFILNEN